MGSGEYLPVMAGVEGLLIEGRPRRYVQIPTAAAPEGRQRLQYWLDLGAAQAERLGVEQVPVVVRDRAEAESEDLAALVPGAGLVYLSGGDPTLPRPDPARDARLGGHRSRLAGRRGAGGMLGGSDRPDRLGARGPGSGPRA